MRKKLANMLAATAFVLAAVANIGCVWSWCDEPDAKNILSD